MIAEVFSIRLWFSSISAVSTDRHAIIFFEGSHGIRPHVVAIVTEALSNVVRHAHARQVIITARHTGAQLSVTIKDDGVGLSTTAVPGYGLRNMHDRAKLLSGELSVTGSNKGTTVQLDIPWKDER